MHPMVYAVIGGLLCLWTRAPSGEKNILGTIISVVSYILYMTILKTFGQNMGDMGFRIVNLVFAVLIPVFIIGLIAAFVFWIVSKARGGQQKGFPEQSPPQLPRARDGHSEDEG
jgi:cellobiose-specific phosphotransferase system component IIC